MGQHHSTPVSPVTPNLPTPSRPTLNTAQASTSASTSTNASASGSTNTQRRRPRSSIFSSLRRQSSPYPSPSLSPSPRPSSPSTPSSASALPAQGGDGEGRRKRKLGDVFRSRRKRARTRSVLGLMGTGVATPGSAVSVGSGERIDVEEEADGEGVEELHEDGQHEEEGDRVIEVSAARSALANAMSADDASSSRAQDREHTSTQREISTQDSADPLTSLLAHTLSSLSQLPTPAPSELHAPTVTSEISHSQPPSLRHHQAPSLRSLHETPEPAISEPLAEERARASALIRQALGSSLPAPAPIPAPPVLAPPLLAPLATDPLPPAPAPAPLPLPAETPTTNSPPSPAPGLPVQLPILPPIPTGTTMIVQGLVQTSAHSHSHPRERTSAPGSGEHGHLAGVAEEGEAQARTSDGDRQARRQGLTIAGGREGTRRAPSPTPSLEEQANMLSTLLSVATAATAASLVPGGAGNPTSPGSGGSTNAVPTAPMATPTGRGRGGMFSPSSSPTMPSMAEYQAARNGGAGAGNGRGSGVGSGSGSGSGNGNGGTASSTQTLRTMLDTLRERLQRSAASASLPPGQSATEMSSSTSTVHDSTAASNAQDQPESTSSGIAVQADSTPAQATSNVQEEEEEADTSVESPASTLAQQASILSSQHATLAQELQALNDQMRVIAEQMNGVAARAGVNVAAPEESAQTGESATASETAVEGATSRLAETREDREERPRSADTLREDLASELTRRLLQAAGAGEAARRGLEEAERRIADLERSLRSRFPSASPTNSTLGREGSRSEPESPRSTSTVGPAAPGQRAREILMDALAAAASHRPTPLPSSPTRSLPRARHQPHHHPHGTQQQQQEFPSALAALPAWTASRQPDPPEEGTFERFLWELQVDLRALLVGRSEERETSEGEQERVAGAEGTERAAGEPEGASALAADAADVPPPSSSTPAESNTAEAARAGQVQRAPPAPQGRTGMVFTSSNGGTTQGGTENDGERLNWWRMYRFPARSVPSEQQQADAARPSGSSGEAGASSSASGEEPRTPPRTPERRARQQEDDTVIPVILVGLRSVTPGNPAPALFDFAEAPSAPGSPVEERHTPLLTPTSPGTALERWNSRERDDGASVGSAGSAPGTNTTSGSNTGMWQRAARLWNRGQRSERARERAQPAPQPAEREREVPAAGNNAVAAVDDSQGTRSYIIWVVGGHYPPNHPIITAPHLLTGQLDHDDLWALGELLGQVKPPTATREDIEKSGLEVIRVTQLKEWEDAGKVASNCTERCLICLGDYEDEEGEDGEIRILGCRHCFHKACVDRWLEQGKNNCPACRSKGVPTASTPSSPTTEMPEGQAFASAAANAVANDDTAAPTASADA